MTWLRKSCQQTAPSAPCRPPLGPEGKLKGKTFLREKGRGGTADWQGLKRDTISWWPDGPADKMLIGSWDLIGFSIYWRTGGERHTSVDFLTDIWIFLSLLRGFECAHKHMCEFTFLFEKAVQPDLPIYLQPHVNKQRRDVYEARLSPSHFFAKESGTTNIMPFAGHRQSHSAAANENAARQTL